MAAHVVAHVSAAVLPDVDATAGDALPPIEDMFDPEGFEPEPEPVPEAEPKAEPETEFVSVEDVWNILLKDTGEPKVPKKYRAY